MQAKPGRQGTDERLREAVAALRQGRLVVVPTDTVYGVAAAPSVPGALDRIYEAKQRDRSKPVAILASDTGKVREFGARMSAVALRLAERFWPGPLTLVLPVGDRWEGFRIPDHPIALALLRAVGGTLYVTSANLSGHPPATTARQAAAELGDSVAVVLDCGKSSGCEVSTVVKVDGDRAEILRDGAIPANEIMSCAKS